MTRKRHEAHFLTTINVSYILNPLIMVCTSTEVIIKEEFEPVISDLFCIQAGVVLLLLLCLQSVSATSAAGSRGISSARRGGMVVVLLHRHSVGKISPITDFYR